MTTTKNDTLSQSIGLARTSDTGGPGTPFPSRSTHESRARQRGPAAPRARARILLHPMPLVPERLTSRAEARAALPAQFWEQPVSSARSLTGATATTPGEPPPLAAQAPQGAVRSQQLLVLQAGVGPVAPGFDGSNGGVVSFGGMVGLVGLIFLKRLFFRPTLFYLSSSTAPWPPPAASPGGPPSSAAPAWPGCGKRTRAARRWAKR